MSRINGQFTFQAPTSDTFLGDDLTSTSLLRIFTATERCTVVEVGILQTSVAAGVGFSFRALKRTGGVSTNDTVVNVFKAAFAAQGGAGGDPSVSNFDNANQIASGVITNTAGTAGLGKALRAFCEVSLDKGDQIVLDVVDAGAATSKGVFYAKAYPMGAGLVESNDVDSN